MRILLLTNKMPYPPTDGGALATLSLALALENAGAKLTVLSVNTKKHFVQIAEIPAEITEKLNFIPVFANTDIRIFELLANFLFSRKPFNAQRFIFKNFNKKLIEILHQNQFDIIQIEGLYMLPYAVTCKTDSNALIAFRAHNIESEIWANYAAEANLIKRFYLKNLFSRLKKFEQSLLNTYDVLIPISKTDAAYFEQTGNNKPTLIIPAGLQPTKNCLETGAIPYSIAYIGALDWHANNEGLQWFIEKVLPIIKAMQPETTFHLAGRNASESFANFIQANHVIYYGEVASAPEFLNNKQIIVVPLHTGSGMRVKIIEAMQLGKPIVCTKKALQGIDALHNEHLLIADSPDEFATQVLRLMQVDQLRSYLSLNAKQFVSKNFDTFALANRLLDFYSEQKKAKALDK